MTWPESTRRTDFDITWFNGTGGGGQHRNKHANCCRMVHRQTGFRTTGQSNRERKANEREAFQSMTKKLIPLMKAAALTKVSASDSTVRIRTYHFPRNEVVDKRIPHERFDLDRILDGKLDDIYLRYDRKNE